MSCNRRTSRTSKVSLLWAAESLQKSREEKQSRHCDDDDRCERFHRRLTLALSGRLRRVSVRHFIVHGPLQRIVMRHLQLVLRDIERPVKDAEDVDITAILDQVSDAIVAIQQDAHMAS